MTYLKTEAGQQALKTRSSLLSARQRSAFILFDGLRSSAEVLALTAGLGVTQGDLDHLLQQGFLLPVPDPVADSGADAAASSGSRRTPQERYSAAMPLATQLTASLGLRGFLLNLAVAATSGHEELLALLPKIQAAVGVAACVELERALND